MVMLAPVLLGALLGGTRTDLCDDVFAYLWLPRLDKRSVVTCLFDQRARGARHRALGGQTFSWNTGCRELFSYFRRSRAALRVQSV